MTTYADLLANRPKPIPADYGWIGALLRGALDADLEAAKYVGTPDGVSLTNWRDMFLRTALKEAGVG